MQGERRKKSSTLRDEARAIERIDRDALDESFDDEARRSVFDEPSFSDALSGEKPANRLDFAASFDLNRAATTAVSSWIWTALLASLSGPISVLTTFIVASGDAIGGFFQAIAVVFIGPTTEEVAKTLLIACVLERSPWRFRSAFQLRLIGLLSGLSFAAIENLLYLKVYFPDPEPSLVVWRWTVCVGLHVGCTLIATEGMVRVWKKATDPPTPPELETAFWYLVAAIAVHGVYNAAMLALSVTGVF